MLILFCSVCIVGEVPNHYIGHKVVCPITHKLSGNVYKFFTVLLALGTQRLAKFKYAYRPCSLAYYKFFAGQYLSEDGLAELFLDNAEPAFVPPAGSVF